MGKCQIKKPRAIPGQAGARQPLAPSLKLNYYTPYNLSRDQCMEP